MKEDFISYELILKYQIGSINPSDINEQYLAEVGIVDEDNKLNRGLLRIGALGSNFIFANETSDEIRVGRLDIRVESKSEERVNYIFNQLKERFCDITIQNAEYNFNVHLMNKGFPKSIFAQYVKSDMLALDAIQLSKGNIKLVMFDCKTPNAIHIKVQVQKPIKKQFGDITVEGDLEYPKLLNVYEDFKTKDLQLSL